MQQVPQARVAEAHWCVGEGDAQAAKLAEWDTSALRTDEINAFLADPQLNDANCFEIYKTKPHKRPIGGKRTRWPIAADASAVIGGGQAGQTNVLHDIREQPSYQAKNSPAVHPLITTVGSVKIPGSSSLSHHGTFTHLLMST